MFVIIEYYSPFARTTLFISLMYVVGVRNINAIEKKRIHYRVCFSPLTSATNCNTT